MVNIEDSHPPITMLEHILLLKYLVVKLWSEELRLGTNLSNKHLHEYFKEWYTNADFHDRLGH